MDEAREDQPVGVIVPAAGQGNRLGGKRKQFRLLGEAPVLIHTVRRFKEHPMIDTVVVSTGADVVAAVEEQLDGAGLAEGSHVVAGGATRQASVAAGLAVLPPNIEVVLVHDAVRPFVTSETIAGVVTAVHENGAAAVAIPVSDTLRRASDGTFGETVDRRGLYRMQTPQGFRRDWLEEAYQRAAEENVRVTDDVALVQRLSYSVALVRGSVRNFKITTSADWELAQVVWAKEAGK